VPRPRCHAEHAAQVFQDGHAPLLVAMHDDFGIGMGAKTCPRVQLDAQGFVVVDFAVENDGSLPSSLKIGWTPASRSIICQPPRAKGQRAVMISAVAVRPAMCRRCAMRSTSPEQRAGWIVMPNIPHIV